MHFRNMYVATPHPVTAGLGMSKRRRLAGPQAASRQELVEMTQTYVSRQHQYSFVFRQITSKFVLLKPLLNFEVFFFFFFLISKCFEYSSSNLTKIHDIAGLILGLHQTNQRRCYKVTLSLIGWAQT